MTPDKCFYCLKHTKEKLYVIPFEEGTALFHMSCFLYVNPDMDKDVAIFLKDKKDKETIK